MMNNEPELTEQYIRLIDLSVAKWVGESPHSKPYTTAVNILKYVKDATQLRYDEWDELADNTLVLIATEADNIAVRISLFMTRELFYSAFEIWLNKRWAAKYN